MSLVKPLFVASIASLTLMMTSMSSTINLLQQIGILPTGAYKSEGLYNYFRCSNLNAQGVCRFNDVNLCQGLSVLKEEEHNMGEGKI